MRDLKFQRWFILSCGPIFGLTGTAKLISVFGHAKVLALDDPILGMSFRHLMLLIGSVELILAFFCLYTSNDQHALGLVAWLATSFAGYRFGLWWLGWKVPCVCMGNLTDALALPPELVDLAMKATLLYLLIGSYSLLFILKKNHSRPMSIET